MGLLLAGIGGQGYGKRKMYAGDSGENWSMLDQGRERQSNNSLTEEGGVAMEQLHGTPVSFQSQGWFWHNLRNQSAAAHLSGRSSRKVCVSR